MQWRPDGDIIEIRNGKGNIVFACSRQEMAKFMATVETLKELSPPETENLELDFEEGTDANPGSGD